MSSQNGTGEQWNMLRLYERLATREATFEFCQEQGLIISEPVCRGCRRPLLLSKRAARTDWNDGFTWRCTNHKCRKQAVKHSVRRGSWFSNSRLSLRKILVLTYCWAAQMPNDVTIRESSIDGGMTSTSTVVDWYNACRRVCLHVLQQQGNKVIGDPGKVVEVDVSKFGHCRKDEDGVSSWRWVLGGICRETKDVFFTEVPDRNVDTLLPLIKQHIAAGSTVITDCYKSFNCLDEEDFQHLIADKSGRFVDLSTGTHMQNIKSQWWQLKRRLPITLSCEKGGFQYYLAEYMWRHKYSGTDHFQQILKDISEKNTPLKTL